MLNPMSKKKLGRFNDLTNAYYQSFICLPRYEHFLTSIFCITEQNSANLGKTSGINYEAMKTFDHGQIYVVLTLVFIQIQETGYFESECSRCNKSIH